uniref:HEAT repeat domain-containing protein n=1 Tax=Streptomyces brasiliscabiei TaxID=2736302 RepID=UPI001C11FE43
QTSPTRLLELVALAEEQPELDALRPYLADPAPAVRREAVAVLTETLPAGTGPALAEALRDSAAEVRAAAAASLRELVETLPPEPALRDGLAAALAEPDPVVRSAALDVLRALSLGDTALFAGSLADSDIGVRIEAVRALVSVDAAVELAHAAPTDPSREVRVTIAKALATISTNAPEPHPPLPAVLTTLTTLTDDPDPLVRAAAYGALGTVGCPPRLAPRAVTALTDPAWQVRAGAATALSTAPAPLAVPALTTTLADPNADVRKATVLSLTHHTTTEEARTALTTATKDSDADVRAYAGRALSS